MDEPSTGSHLRFTPMMRIAGMDVRARLKIALRLYPAFWAIPAMILNDSAAAAFGFINGTGHLDGFFGPHIISYLSDHTHSLLPGFAFIGSCYLAAFFIMRFRILRTPSSIPERAAVPGSVA